MARPLHVALAAVAWATPACVVVWAVVVIVAVCVAVSIVLSLSPRSVYRTDGLPCGRSP